MPNRTSRTATEAAPIVTFYSVKGGVGRTLAALGVGQLLAGRGLRALVVDLDLAAPGLSWLACDKVLSGAPKLEVGALLADRRSWQELAADELVAGLSHTYAMPAALIEVPGGALRILPVGDIAGERLPELRALIERMAGAVDIVLVDSGAGDARVPAAFGDHVALFTALNHQHVVGTCAFLRALRAVDDRRPGLQLVLSPMPLGEDELTVRRTEAACDAFAAALGRPVELPLRIDYHPRLALTELPHPSQIGRGALHLAHTAIAAAMLGGLAAFDPDLLHQALRASLDAGRFERALHALRALRAASGERGLGAVFWLLRDHMAPAPDDPALQSLYQWLAEAFAADAGELAMFATALHRADNPQALRFYERALAAAPGDADLLGNFASFLSEVAGEPARAEATYLAALAADRRHADNLGNYANFLTGVRGDHERAELCYLAAIEVSPEDADHLTNYANFLTTIRHDDPRAESYYKRAIAAAPDDANARGNLARLLFAAGRGPEGQGHLVHALELAAEADPLRCELLFYAYAHAPEVYPQARESLIKMLDEGVRSPGWDLRANVARAEADGHADPELLARLARVIAGEASLAALER